MGTTADGGGGSRGRAGGGDRPIGAARRRRGQHTKGDTPALPPPPRGRAHTGGHAARDPGPHAPSGTGGGTARNTTWAVRRPGPSHEAALEEGAGVRCRGRQGCPPPPPRLRGWSPTTATPPKWVV